MNLQVLGKGLVPIYSDENSDLQRESYKMLEEKAGCNLKQRVENMKMRALTNEMCKSKVDKINALDVIAEDKKLKEIYIGIVNKIYLKHK